MFATATSGMTDIWNLNLAGAKPETAGFRSGSLRQAGAVTTVERFSAYALAFKD